MVSGGVLARRSKDRRQSGAWNAGSYRLSKLEWIERCHVKAFRIAYIRTKG